MLTSIKRGCRELLTELFDRNGLDTVFAHARNVLTGAAVIAAGMYAVSHVGTGNLRGMWTVHLAGYGVSALGAILLAMNLFDGLRRLARRNHAWLLRLAAIAVYVAISIRLTQVIIFFRSGA